MYNMSNWVRKPTIWASDQVLQKLACTVTEAGQKPEISDNFKKKGIVLCRENKGADQLCSDCTVDVRLCYGICRILVFLCGGSCL